MVLPRARQSRYPILLRAHHNEHERNVEPNAKRSTAPCLPPPWYAVLAAKSLPKGLALSSLQRVRRCRQKAAFCAYYHADRA